MSQVSSPQKSNTRGGEEEEVLQSSISKPNKPEATSEQFEDQIRKNKAKLSENDRIKLLVVRVCEDNPKTFVLSIQKLTDQIIEYAQKPEKIEYKEVLIRYFVDSVSLLSFKQAVYATVLSLVYLKSKEIFDEILKRITDQFQKSIDQGERIKSKNILIFLGELMNIGVINCYNYRQLVNQILEQCKSLEKQEEREYYLSIIIGSLGNVQEILRKKIGHEFDQIVKEISTLMNKRDTSYISIFKNKYNKDKDLDRLNVLWQSILRDIEKSKNQQTSSDSAADSTQSQQQSQQSLSLKNTYLQFQNDLKNIEQPEFTFTVEFKNHDLTKCVYQSPIFSSTILKTEEEIERLREEEEQLRSDDEEEEEDDEEEMDEQQDDEEEEEDYDDEDDEGRGQKSKKTKKKFDTVPKKQGSSKRKTGRKLFAITTERLIWHENILQTIQLFRQSKKNLFQQIQMLMRVSGEDNESQKSQTDFIFASFVDILINESLRAKNGSAEDEVGSRVLYYSSLANTLHALRKEESADLVFDGFNEIYRNLSEYTCDSVENLAEFLSHIISETHLQFPWNKIAPSASNQQLLTTSIDPSILFCRDLIHRLCQLCGREKVTQAINDGQTEQQLLQPSLLLTFLTPVSAKETIKTRFQDGSDPLAKLFMERLVQKKTSDEMLEEINGALKEGGSKEDGEDEEEEDEDNRMEGGVSDSHRIRVLSVFLECLFFRSCETVTHLKILYDRYALLIKKLFEDHGAIFQQTLIDTLLLFWQNSLFNLEIYLKKFISNNFITAQAVAESIFDHLQQIQVSPTNVRQIHQLWLFLRRITFNIADTYHNYSEEVKASIILQSQLQPEDEDKAAEIESLNQKFDKANKQLTDLLELIFSKFAAIFQENSSEEIKEKQYDIYFLFFYRKYKKLVDWENTYQHQFDSCKSISQSVIQSYRI